MRCVFPLGTVQILLSWTLSPFPVPDWFLQELPFYYSNWWNLALQRYDIIRRNVAWFKVGKAKYGVQQTLTVVALKVHVPPRCACAPAVVTPSSLGTHSRPAVGCCALPGFSFPLTAFGCIFMITIWTRNKGRSICLTVGTYFSSLWLSYSFFSGMSSADVNCRRKLFHCIFY